ncbi:unnamed protein product, partial [Heterosigma akashiwo]
PGGVGAPPRPGRRGPPRGALGRPPHLRLGGPGGRARRREVLLLGLLRHPPRRRRGGYGRGAPLFVRGLRRAGHPAQPGCARRRGVRVPAQAPAAGHGGRRPVRAGRDPGRGAPGGGVAAGEPGAAQEADGRAGALRAAVHAPLLVRRAAAAGPRLRGLGGAGGEVEEGGGGRGGGGGGGPGERPRVVGERRYCRRFKYYYEYNVQYKYQKK